MGVTLLGYKFRKIVTFILSSVIVMASANPASAWVDYRPIYHADSIVDVTVGDVVDLDYSCSNGAIDQGQNFNYSSGQMPPGLTWDNATSHITGTPTEAGTYVLPDVGCLHDGLVEVFGVGSIRVSALETPTPSLTVTALSDDQCSVRLIGLLPKQPDAGSAQLWIENNSSVAVVGIADTYQAGTLFDFTFPMSDLSQIEGQNMVSSFTSGTSNDICGTDISFMVVYAYAGAAPASYTVYATPTAQNTGQALTQTPTPNLAVVSLNNDSCEFKVIGTLPADADAGSVKLIIDLEGPTSFAQVSLRDYLANELIDLTMSGIDLSLSLFDSNVTAIETAGDYLCNSNINVSLEYSTQGLATASASQLFTPTPASLSIDANSCDPGTYSYNGQLPCIQASRGFYVDNAGATYQIPCDLGFYQPNYGQIGCLPAPQGTYVPETASTSFTPCPSGQTTLLLASRSHFECYKVTVQTAKKLKTPSKAKIKTKFLTLMTTDQGKKFNIAVSGPCSAKTTTTTARSGGKSTRVMRFQITAGKSSGTCLIVYSYAGDETNTALTITKAVKIVKR